MLLSTEYPRRLLGGKVSGQVRWLEIGCLEVLHFVLDNAEDTSFFLLVKAFAYGIVFDILHFGLLLPFYSSSNAERAPNPHHG